jgi:ribosome biogenesis GTPase / thiamine phosphate phosphatase
VHDGAALRVCTISNVLRKQLVYPLAAASSLRQRVVGVEQIDVADPVAVGDRVRWRDAGDGSGVIDEVLPRANQLARRAAGLNDRHVTSHALLDQIIVANVDQLVVVLSASQPAPNWELVDRYLLAAEAAEIEAHICITKLDLMTGPAHQTLLERNAWTYRNAGYAVLLTSAVTGEGLDALAATLSSSTSVLAGMSGVGKTTLLNALQPGLGQRVAEVSRATGKGKHTTTHLEMYHNAPGAVRRGAGPPTRWPYHRHPRHPRVRVAQRAHYGAGRTLPRDAPLPARLPLRRQLHPHPRTRLPHHRGRRERGRGAAQVRELRAVAGGELRAEG